MVHISLILVMMVALVLSASMIGGESVTSVTVVSNNGSDTLLCLDSGLSKPCKTLGHVLSNMPNIKCTNCTIVVLYDHKVFPQSNTTYPVDVSSITYLHICGEGKPDLEFNGSGIILKNDNSSGSTEVLLENMAVLHCGRGVCIAPEGFNNGPIKNHLLKFKLMGVTMHGVVGILGVAAQNVEYRGCLFLDNKFAALWIQAPESHDFNYIITNCTFKQTSGYLMITLSSYRPFSGSVNIEKCTFIDVTGFSINAIINTSITSITLNVLECTVEDSSIDFIAIEVNDITSTVINGIITVAKNSFRNSSGYKEGLITTKYNKNINAQCLNKVKVIYTDNTFISNTGILMTLTQWPTFDISNSTYNNNIGNSHLLLINYDDTSHNHSLCKRNIHIDNVTFASNRMIKLSPANDQAVITINIDNCNSLDYTIVLSNVIFSGNIGTPLSLIGVPITIKGNVMFDSNNGVTGGGLYIDRNTIISIADNTTVSFINNNALYGGAVYIDLLQSKCFLDNTSTQSMALHGNTATVGHSVFSSKSWCQYHGKCEELFNVSMIASLPTNVTINGTNFITAFPGQTIIQNMSVTDCHQQDTSCAANVYLFCDKRYCASYIHLQGLPSIYITSGNIDTGLEIMRNGPKQPNVTKPELVFICKTPTAILPFMVNVTVDVINCPLGLSFTTSQQCHCLRRNTGAFICSESIGKACVRKGFWYGNVSDVITVSKCLHLFCDYSSKRDSCLLDITPDATNYVLLSYLEDDQCLDGHGGTLCTECTKGRTATYGSHYCIPTNQCRQWHPYILLLLNIMCPLAIGILLVVVLQLKLSIGSGYMYGPLFYLAVLDLIPLGTLGKLDSIVNFFAATFLLKFQVLGLLRWCFFPVSLLSSTYFELIAPLVVSIVVLLTVYIARCVPRFFQIFQKSPVQAICVLILISFWSLASTAVQIITPVYLSGVDGVRVHLQPDSLYLHGEHIPLWIIAVLILFFLLIITIGLILSPFLSLHRIKPLLDEFQSCYKDNFRWYGGVYFCTWIVLQALILTSNYLIFQTCIIVLAAVHFLAQPYSRRWLNLMDGFLLISLNITTSLSAQDTNNIDLNDENSATKKEVLVYISVVIPLSLIAIGTLGLRLKLAHAMKHIIQCLYSKVYQCYTSRRSQTATAATPVTHTTVRIEGLNNENTIADREPLLQYLSHDYMSTSIQI